MRSHRHAESVLFGALGVLGFSGTLPATRAAIGELGPIVMGLGRALVSAALAAAVLFATRAPRPSRKELLPLSLAAAGVVIGFPLFAAIALRTVPAVHASIVIGLIPIVQSVAAVVRHGERPRPFFWFASALGVGAVVFFATAEGAGRPQLADLWLLLAMMSAGIGYAEGGVLAREIGGWRVICWALLLAAPVLAVPVAIDVAHRSLHVSARAWAGFAYVSTISMFLAFFAWYKSLALGGIAAGGQMLLFQPILSAVWAALLLGEPIGRRAIAAALLVLVSVALSRWSLATPASP
ncbi:MAG TPA: DMT family transporter [Myxococcales bacterium]|nr:DMT family transporter [Myxococcales bacterium]